ncbi:MAG: DUF3604 domain-containing protein [Alphaproteobacteria bacterium]
MRKLLPFGRSSRAARRSVTRLRPTGSVLLASALALIACTPSPAPRGPAAAPAKAPDAAVANPPSTSSLPTRVWWGDEHVHSGWSADAGLSGTILSPEDAVRFVRGETVRSNTGLEAKLAEPLDWVVVTDHSDGMGTINQLRDGAPEFLADPTSRRWGEMMKQCGDAARQATNEAVNAQANGRLPKVLMDPKWMVSAWEKTIEIMERYDEPGRFTAFIGYEWTSNAVAGDNLHRNVIYRDGGDRARQMLPLTTFQSRDPATLWAWLAAYEAKTGGKVLAIPHNGNLSNGRMFEEKQYDGSAMTRAWAEARARWEPLFEVYQYKGQSEAHPALSPADEFANFELWDTANLDGVTKKPSMLRTEYWREALGSGMRLESSLGVNPFRLGAVAGTDTHTGLSAPIEDNFWGKFPATEPSADRWEHVYKKEDSGWIRRDWTLGAQGYTGVWAAANTREALWDAMMRRETYASSGPRITVRFFGGWDFTDTDAKSPGMVAAGYARGVPMGGSLRAAAGRRPTFLVAATKATGGANLDRAQVVKGWVDANGKQHERIWDVAWSDLARRRPVKGKLPPVGDTVDLRHATYTNDIGATELFARFEDPDFDPRQRAFYYLRVLEIPTPRWTAYDAALRGAKPSADVTMKQQERAATSPIWYDPA